MPQKGRKGKQRENSTKRQIKIQGEDEKKEKGVVYSFNFDGKMIICQMK